MKIVFMGTPDFAIPSLEKLKQEHEIIAVYTREPKIAGRGNKILKTPVHLWAEQHNIPVHTPKTLRLIEEQNKFSALKADIAVVAAYGLILPRPILTAFPYGCVNIHGSLLPRWRGAAPIERAIEAGDEKTGITIMKMDEGLDTGDMLLKEEVKISDDTTGESLRQKLSVIGADLIAEALRNWKYLTAQKQNDDYSCYAARIEKQESSLDFNISACALERKIRAFNPYPGIYFEHKGERFKIWRAVVTEEKIPVGTITCRNNRLYIGCMDKALEIIEIQRQGKKVMNTVELLRGYNF